MKKITWTIVSLLAAVTFFPARMQAQSYPIYFPYVVNDGQATTELILTNGTAQNANVRLTAYRQDGSVATQTSVSVAASSQAIVESSAFASFQGWVLGSSDLAGVAADIRVNAADGSAQNTSESATPDTTLVFPFAAESSGTSTEIAVVNPSAVNARVALTLFGSDGRAIATADSLMAPYAMIRGTVTELFGSGHDYSNASHVIARYTPPNIFSQIVNLVGFEVVRGFARTAADATLQRITARKDWGSLTGLALSEAGSSMTFPQVLRGQDWFSLIGIANLTDTPQTVTLTYAPATNASAATRSISMPGNGSIRLTAVDLFGPGADSGSVRVASGGNIAGFLATGRASSFGFSTASGQNKAQAEFCFPVVDETDPAFTGIGLLNDNTVQSTVDLFLVSPQGATLGHTTQVLLPGQRLAKLVREFFIEGLNVTGGWVFVRSSAPLFATAVNGVPDKVLNDSPSQPAAPGFAPPAQTLFVVKGRVTDNGTGARVAGVTITLARPGSADITTATDAAGQYVFKNMISGDYTLAPSQAGRTFAPIGAVVHLVTVSAEANFLQGVPPAISALTVVTNDSGAQMTAGNNPDAFAVFGTSEVSLKITGSNFASGQTVFFGSRAIAASNVNIVDSKTIFVKLVLNSSDILAELVPQGYYGSYNIAIGGQSPFTDTRSNTLPFYILPPLPVLTSVASSNGTNQTYARYEIDSPGETLTVSGFGFRSGARVLFDGRTALNGIELDTKFISSTQLSLYLPPQSLRYGGIYTLRVRNVSSLPEVSGEAVSFQVNNLRPEITSIDPPGPLQLIGPGTTPVFIDLTINGSNFHPAPSDPASNDPGTLTFVTLKIPDIFPAIVPVGGQQGCIVINGRTILRVKVFDATGAPAVGIPVTFTARDVDTDDKASGYFLPSGQSTVTTVTDSQGFAPPLTDASIIFQANAFAGTYVVKVEATVSGLRLKSTFNITNLNPGERCEGPGKPTVRFVSSSQLIVTQYPITSRGTYSVMVANASPGGGVSREIEFVVTSGPTSGVPTISTANSLSPASRTAGSATFNLTVFRDTSTSVPFQQDAWVNFGTVRLNRVAGDTSTDSITVSVPTFLIASPGLVPVTVTNPGTSGTTGGTSNRVVFTVQ